LPSIEAIRGLSGQIRDDTFDAKRLARERAETPWVLNKKLEPMPLAMMSADDLKKRDEHLTVAQLGQAMNPNLFGIECPYNRNEHGPARRPIRCGVWKDWDDYNTWSGGGHKAQRFCKEICHYGHMSQEDLTRARLTIEHARARTEERIAFQRKHGLMREGGLGILVQNAPARKVVTFRPDLFKRGGL